MSEAPQHFGKYRILGELGRGGFATVYGAVDTTLDREVALKILHPQLLSDSGFVQRFRQEARTLASLRHPQVVTVYEVGESDGRLFIAMEWARGPNLAQVIDERGRIPWVEALALLRPVCAALDYAHGQGIVHRDLKPANILLDQERGPLLTDFGFARLVGTSSVSLSISGGIAGTPGYIAPEVWELNATAAPVDIYALGCIVYELLTGAALFRGQTPMQVMRAHDCGPEFPEAWPDGVPSGVEQALRKALARDPAARYPSATALWQALNNLTAPALHEAPKRRIPLMVWVAGALLLAIGAYLLYPSPAPTMVQVPNLVGLDDRAAAAALQNVGLKADRAEEPSNIPLGRVIRQDPPAGASLPANSFVKYIVSLGSPPSAIPDVEVPNLVGLEERVALQELQGARLRADRGEEPSETVPAGQVISQDPAAGVRIREQSLVKYIVSLGPAAPADDIRGFRVREISEKEIEITVDHTYRSNQGDDVRLGAAALSNGARLDRFSYRPVQISAGDGTATIGLVFGDNNPPATATTGQIQIRCTPVAGCSSPNGLTTLKPGLPHQSSRLSRAMSLHGMAGGRILFLETGWGKASGQPARPSRQLK